MAEMTMEELLNLEEATLPVVGDIVTGKVVAIAGQEVTVDIGAALDATVYLSELSAGDAGSVDEVVSIGSEIRAVIKKADDEQILLSVKAVHQREKQEEIAKALESGTPISATVKRAVRGGLTVDLGGIEAFLPGSQVDTHFVEDLSVYVGQTFNVKVDAIRGRRIVVVRRELVAAEREQAMIAALATLKVGDKVDGKVVRLTTFGAFVSFNGVEGLVHISEISHARVSKAEDALEVGQEVQAVITKIDGDKIGLSIKKLLPTPVEEFGKSHQIGEIVTGKVTSVHEYGGFVEIAPGVEGLVHASELTWDGGFPKVSDFLKKGQKLEVKVIDIKPEDGRISLSVKQTESDPWETMAVTVGDVVNGKVMSMTDIGAFINIAPYIDGLCHFSEASWGHEKLEDLIKEGDEVQVKVIGIDVDRKRVALSLRQVTKNPWEEVGVKRGDIVTGTVASLDTRGAEIKVAEGVVGFLPIGQISDRRLSSANEALALDEEGNYSVPIPF